MTSRFVLTLFSVPSEFWKTVTNHANETSCLDVAFNSLFLVTMGSNALCGRILVFLPYRFHKVWKKIINYIRTQIKCLFDDYALDVDDQVCFFKTILQPGWDRMYQLDNTNISVLSNWYILHSIAIVLIFFWVGVGHCKTL